MTKIHKQLKYSELPTFQHVAEGHLTMRQEWVWSYMLDHQETHDRPPTMRELIAVMKVRSTRAACDIVDALVRKGFAVRGPKRRAHGTTRAVDPVYAPTNFGEVMAHGA